MLSQPRRAPSSRVRTPGFGSLALQHLEVGCLTWRSSYFVGSRQSWNQYLERARRCSPTSGPSGGHAQAESPRDCVLTEPQCKPRSATWRIARWSGACPARTDWRLLGGSRCGKWCRSKQRSATGEEPSHRLAVTASFRIARLSPCLNRWRYGCAASKYSVSLASASSACQKVGPLA